MRYSISYSSLTGNTQSLAEYMRVVLPSKDCLFFGSNADIPHEIIPEVDTLFIGFWTYNGRCDSDTTELIKIIRGKRLAIFGTSAFVGSKPYFARIVSRITPFVDQSCTMVEPFICMGRITEEMLARYNAALKQDPDNARLIRLIKNYEHIKSHPDSNDFNNLLAWIKSVLKDA